MAGAVEKLCFGEIRSVVIVAAHPDDETIGAAAQLGRWKNLSIISVTDGAPRNLADALAAGCANRADYARARKQELRTALDIVENIGSSPQLVSFHQERHSRERIKVFELGFVDQEAAFHLPEMVNALLKWLAFLLLHRRRVTREKAPLTRAAMPANESAYSK